jgi:nucleoside-diphosphate-sugar epimerase
MEIAARIADHPEVFGADWMLPGGGPLTGAQVADTASRHLARRVKLRSAGVLTLRLVSLFNKDLRGFMQMAPDYIKPIAYDAAKLEGLIGRQTLTSYEDGIAHTLDALTAEAAS